MKHKLIQTENYLLIVDDSEIKAVDWFINKNNQISKCVKALEEWLKTNKSEIKKIIAHLPINGATVLEGVDLLPPIEDDDKEVWEKGLEAELKKLPYTKHLDDGQYNDGQLVGFELGATWGYNKHKEKYKYTEEDILIIRNKLVSMLPTGDVSAWDMIMAASNYTKWFDEYIQSLQQPKMPVGFECEMKMCENNDVVFEDGSFNKSPYRLEKKKIKNLQNQTVWVGKYIFND